MSEWQCDNMPTDGCANHVCLAVGLFVCLQHFVCAKCEKPFLGHRHYERKGLAYCETHYNQVTFNSFVLFFLSVREHLTRRLPLEYASHQKQEQLSVVTVQVQMFLKQMNVYWNKFCATCSTFLCNWKLLDYLAIVDTTIKKWVFRTVAEV